MASASFKSLAVVFMVAVIAAAASVSAQDLAPAPAPAMDKGAAYSLGMPVAVICSSLLLSMLSLFKH
ncbi:hypothetical protein MANES_07G004700v8 [Manihot esculenta]|uniref:Uncharacterized protein n=1 Tax=Manihot esculenta TaxID=3983 RepID=A0A2C9VIK1_MANES|nr:hypothetical protein MANES_07G004700v8 [Manihot esculenta]